MAFGRLLQGLGQRRSELERQDPELRMNLLCDGGTTRNPGGGQRAVHDGTRFLPPAPVGAGKNTKAVYVAAAEALRPRDGLR